MRTRMLVSGERVGAQCRAAILRCPLIGCHLDQHLFGTSSRNTSSTCWSAIGAVQGLQRQDAAFIERLERLEDEAALNDAVIRLQASELAAARVRLLWRASLRCRLNVIRCWQAFGYMQGCQEGA